MATLVSPNAIRRTSAKVLAICWIFTSTVFVYLDVPVFNAPLFAAQLVLQASLGCFVVTRLLKSATPTILLFFGPGLILGGVVAFFVFQAVGRGVFGLVATIGLSLAALVSLLPHFDTRDWVSLSPALPVHALGLAALAASSEFPWLFVVAVGSFVCALVLESASAHSRVRKLFIFVGYGLVLAVATLFRGTYWWLITDDYKFFDVLARHITVSGPFAEWGSLDVSRYHWLSYGWSGLLDYASGTPEVLVTLTRVMPFVYSVALASSLLFVAEKIAGRNTTSNRFTIFLPVWVLLASFRLDWAAPSTAGVFAVLAAAVALLVLAVDRQSSLPRRLSLYSLVTVTVLLTKLPSVLVLPGLFLAVESQKIVSGHHAKHRRLVATLAVTLAAVAAISLLAPLSALLGDFSVRWQRPAGQPLSSGFPFSLISPFAQHFWILIVIAVTWKLESRNEKETEHSSARTLLLALSPMFAAGVLMNAVIPNTEKANVHEYFSMPNYFLAALCVSLIGLHLPDNIAQLRANSRLRMWLVLGGLAFGTQLLTSRLLMPIHLDQSSLHVLLGDCRILFGIVVTVSLFLRETRIRVRPWIPVLTLLLVALAETASMPVSNLIEKGVRPTLPTREVDSYLGSSDTQRVGDWLRKNTDDADVIATNYLYLQPRSGVFGDDYSLAMWSRREFLVLGPKFFGMAESATDEISLSNRFGDGPTPSDARALQNRGVKWFVADTSETDRRDWQPYATVEFKGRRFWVLRLDSQP